MSSKKGSKGGDAPAAYDPQALLCKNENILCYFKNTVGSFILCFSALYGMQYAGLGGLSNLGAAYSGLTSQASSSAGQSQNGAAATVASSSSSDAATSATNAWYAMASQLAAQDYLTRLQAAARDPAAYAALASQGVLPNYEMLTQGSKGGRSKAGSSKGRNSPAASSTSSRASPAASSPSLDALRLPSDTEIIKYTSSSTGPKVPGTTNRGRKKTISLDPSPSPYASAASATNFGALGALLGAAASQGDLGNGGADLSPGAPPAIPPGLTIERKKPGRKPMDPDNHVASASASAPMVDRVEITKVPINSSSSAASGGSNGRSDSPSVSITARDFPASSSHALSSLMLSTSSDTNAATITPTSSKIPSDYYATQALSGVFLAEQIRQQQLAAALESRLSESGKSSGTSTTDLVQAALLMNRLKEQQQQQQQGSSNTLGAAETSKLLAIAAAAAAASNPDHTAAWKSPTTTKSNRKVPPKKNTVASLLEQAKAGGLGTSTLSNPELTIEPLFKSFQPDR